MALITCPECGASISDAAATCPHCGLPFLHNPLQQLAAVQQQPAGRRREAKYPDHLFWPRWACLILAVVFELGTGRGNPSMAVGSWVFGIAWIGLVLASFALKSAWRSGRR